MSALFFLWPVMGRLVWSSILLDRRRVVLAFSISSTNAIFYSSVIAIAIRVSMWGIYYMGGNKMPVFFFVLLTMFVGSILILILRESYLAVFLG